MIVTATLLYAGIIFKIILFQHYQFMGRQSNLCTLIEQSVSYFNAQNFDGGTLTNLMNFHQFVNIFLFHLVSYYC